MKTRLIPLLVVMLLVPRFAHAAETWTDDRLPVRDGLELWFDCARQNAGRSARQLPPIASGNPADYLIDGSGRGRNLTQAHPEYRPRFRQEFNGAFLSFDGQDDVLGASRLEGELTDLTLFVVAAPRSNAGGFRGLVAWSRAGGNDYTTGLCLGYSLGPTLQLAEINAEGAGFSGAAQLKQGPPTPFGVWHVFSLESQPGGLGTKLAIDGKAQGARGRDNLPTSLNEFTLGARHYSNTPEPPFTQGFYHGEIAEVLVYGRVLDVTEKAAVQRYLDTKHGLLLKLPPSAPVDTQQLVTVTNPPAIQMLVPGFAAFQLPVSLNNINNVKYRADGKLVAVGYNGHIHLLSNTEGDGSGTRVTPFWTNNTLRSPIGMALTPPGYARGEGVFVAGKGKVSLIVDTNRDDHADAEIVVAEGWEELVHSVDALGIAVDRDGSVYFGLGTASYTEAYRVDKATGQSRYSLKSERGTILKVSPDFKKREIVCTGIRFPIGMAFNEAGDLFSTDQEGATWLPNGNPFDELLHIQTGRHYGFPPRHPRYLTGVIDEPSVYDYGPQHQSTCGLNFNLPVNGGPAFGPAWWAGDAIVCGYSRGKIWRTKLVKTAAGYVAQNQQIASLSALTVDACVSPDGGLLVATHSGEPDWGSGPNGPGQLYKIIHDPGLTPLPVLAWNEGPGELRVAFDRPVNAAGLTNLARLVEITRGQYVFAGDRFEVKRPGYATVYNQLMQPRRAVPVLSASLTPDLRTLVFQTAPREMAVNYAVTLHRFARGPGRHPREVGQHPDVDLLTDLSGLEAHWRAAGEPAAKWDGWLPHVDLTVAREFTRGSAGHDSLWPLLQKPGKLALRGQLDLKKMLQPAVQPGSTLDYEPPPEDVTVVFSASAPFLLVAGGQTISSQKVEGVQQAALRWRNDKRDWLAFKVTMPTSPVAPTLTAHWFTADDPRPRAFPLRRILVPWAKPESGTSAPAGERKIPELAGGNWLRGKQLFFGEVATCYKCHTVRGAGAKVGPDLSNLIHRDYASVLKDIREPSAALNPDHLAYSVELTDGESVTGVLGADAWDQVAVINAEGLKLYPKARVKSVKASGISLMPEGLDKALSPEQLKDLLTFLLTEPLSPAPLEAPGEPPLRPRAEVESALGTNQMSAAITSPFRVVLCAGPKDHGPGEHDYPLWQKRWDKLLALAEGVEPDTAAEWPSNEQWRDAKVIVFYSDLPGWNPARAAQLEAFLNRGGGAVFLHYAVDGHNDVEALAKLIGLAWRGGASKFRHGPLDLTLKPGPLTAGLGKIHFVDESYWNLVGDPKQIDLVASGEEEGAAQPLMWTRQHGAGRVFVSIPGHYSWTFDDPLFRVLILRGICWAGGQPVERLAPLATLGARTSD